VSTTTIAPCPVQPLDVVVTVSQWADIAKTLAGTCGNVGTIIKTSGADPHDYEPTASDIAAIGDADLVIVNGLDYDHWASDAVDALDSQPAVIDTGAVAGLQEGDNPHLWYGPTYVAQVADAISIELSTLQPDAAQFFETQNSQWDQLFARINNRITEIKSTDTTYAATESVFEYMANDLGFVNATPQGYQRAAANESEPGPSDIAAFIGAIEGGSVNVLIYNSQTAGPAQEQIRQAAQDNNVPVVEVTESIPAEYSSYIEWQLAQLDALAKALGK
jgi:zinc/manganese transport system substrate-binding protein